MSISRRNFIKGGLGIMTCCLAPAQLFTLASQAANLAPRQAGKSRVLVVVQLNGGNDGLNTVIPYSLNEYYQARHGIAIKPADVLPLTNQIGLNPNLTGFANLYKGGKLAIVQAVGYPYPNRSHFRSTEVWQTAEPNRIIDTGWLGRFLDLAVPAGTTQLADSLPAINIDPTLPKTLSARKVLVPSVSVDLLHRTGTDANEDSEHLLKVVANYQENATYPHNSFGAGLKFFCQMIVGKVNSRVYSLSMDGFDTHTNQSHTQSNLLRQLSDGLGAFQSDLESNGVDRDVLIFVFSEFGRRVQENGGRGTDHGTAAPVFIIGSPVKGGIYGEHPSLTQLDEGNLRYRIDFRSVYATILDRWLLSDSRQVLGANFDHIGFV